MSEIYAAYCARNAWDPGDPNAIRGGLRKGDGHGHWVDISLGLREHIETVSNVRDRTRWYITDMWFVQNSLTVTWCDGANNNSGVSRLVGNTWRHPIVTVGRETIYSGFFCYKGRPFIFGTFQSDTMNRGKFAIWDMLNSSTNVIIPYMYDAAGEIPFQITWRGCGFMSPTVPDTLILGDAYEDSFSYVNLKNKTWHAGSYPGGCCVFAMGIDNHKLIWAGDYGNYYYGSWDGGINFERTGGSGGEAGEHGLLPDTGLSELWEMKHWKGNLYGVGCDPCGVVRRTSVVDHTHGHFEKVATFPELGGQDGVGFMSFQPQGNELVIGFGGEPFYYIRSAIGKVYRMTVDNLLHDISGGLNWGSGVHQVCDSTRTCANGNLAGQADDQGVRYDNSTDTSYRLLSQP